MVVRGLLHLREKSIVVRLLVSVRLLVVGVRPSVCVAADAANSIRQENNGDSHQSQCNTHLRYLRKAYFEDDIDLTKRFA